MAYSIKQEKFEGPLELLLELIEKEQLEITELSLSRVANEYLEYIRGEQNINLENLTDFLTVASRLILIKSRVLLPMLRFSDEEEDEIKDLAFQLEQYKKFKEIAQKVGKLAARGKISYSREGFSGIKSIFYPPDNINSFDLRNHFQTILSEIPLIEKLEEEFIKEVITLEEKIEDLQNFLRSKIEASFSSLVENAEDKIEVIISFLAVLEMVKQQIVEVRQENLFSEIKLNIKTI